MFYCYLFFLVSIHFYTEPSDTYTEQTDTYRELSATDLKQAEDVWNRLYLKLPPPPNALKIAENARDNRLIKALKKIGFHGPASGNEEIDSMLRAFVKTFGDTTY